ncbi:diguanylate phosphodiesterase [Lysinibacillus sphaericus]|uniref:Putative cyclic-di-GMP phosphodiesterase YjcC n=1 Tax=Lysinibacillus sphaericus TaxID=1421 RepID=A0A2S5D2W8_LYSSH|nr:EAL domain-containing protein [Lysinibacillus sphaericus]OEC02075.1 diguanylate phosphodiesterase [Lysinibacillus sphaericus]POZ57414.1 putative cyclic-di-GMP phosphodiesterase YjcC [Lysinibacillus sphaericus]
MPCKSCLVLELQFDIQLKGQQNLSLMEKVVNYFKRRGLLISVKDDFFIIQESGVRELLDFCHDYMDLAQVYFRFDNRTWQPITEIEPILEMKWIDEVIRKKSVISFSQPIIDANEEIYAYEILSRFPREDGSLIYPNEIFTAARSRGRLYALDRICRMAAVRYSAVLKKKTFINFIPTSIYSPEFCLQTTVQLANQLGIDPNQFVFEVVESDKVDDIEHLKSILNYYKQKGFQYALDDVGEGYNTLEMLADLKPQYMKLDIKYVQGVSGNSEKQAVAKQFLAKAFEVNAIPLAEGIESRADFEWLKENGYQLFQGYLFGKPSIHPQRKL